MKTIRVGNYFTLDVPGSTQKRKNYKYRWCLPLLARITILRENKRGEVPLKKAVEVLTDTSDNHSNQERSEEIISHDRQPNLAVE